MTTFETDIPMTEYRSLYLLTGGKSRRMGQDKASLTFDDFDTLLEYQVERCHSVFHDVVLLSGQKTYPVPNRHVFDELADAGPLSGILSGLRDARSDKAGEKAPDTIAVMAVDLPLVTLETLHHLFTRPMPEDCDVLIAGATRSPLASGGDGAESAMTAEQKTYQPLLGIYHSRVEKQLEDYLKSGNRSVAGFLEQVRVSVLPVKEEEIRNINTKEEYQKVVHKRKRN